MYQAVLVRVVISWFPIPFCSLVVYFGLHLLLLFADRLTCASVLFAEFDSYFGFVCLPLNTMPVNVKTPGLDVVLFLCTIHNVIDVFT